MPAPAAAETAVRDYLRALSDPSSLRDDGQIEQLQSKLSSSQDGVERVRLRQQLLDAETPSIDRYEEGFVTHAKAWADETGITARAFNDEGVANDVLRRAGFVVSDGRRRGRSARQAPAGQRARRTRVTAEDVRGAIPDGAFTIKALQDSSGASPAVVRKVVAEEESSGRLRNEGTDPDHRGPGRAPVLYHRV